MNNGDPASVQCFVSGGDLPLQVSWLHNGYPISDNDDLISMGRLGHRLFALNIDSLQGEHSGNYTCLAKNVAGTAEHTAVLIVNGLIIIYFSFTHLLNFLPFYCVSSFILIPSII